MRKYALCPGSVLKDDRLRASDKLAYGVILANCDEQGVCRLTNEQVAEMVCVSKSMMEKCIRSLVRSGLVVSTADGGRSRRSMRPRVIA